MKIQSWNRQKDVPLLCAALLVPAFLFLPGYLHNPRCDTYTPANQPLIAHAGGGLPYMTYADNLAALDMAASHRFKFAELDFQQRGNELILGHDDKHLSGTTFAQLLTFLAAHPEISIVTDIKTPNIAGLSLIPPKWRSRFIPQIYQPDQLEPARELGYSRIIFAERWHESENWFPWVNSADLWAVAISKEKLPLAKSIRHPVFLYTVNEPTPGVGLYTDCLVPIAP